MFLNQIARKNPALIKTAVELHQSGQIPPNTYVFDADIFEENGRKIRFEAEKYGLKLYYMTKQHARNPELFRRVIKPGAKETVCVNMQCARILHRHGIGIGHMGNLCQVPKVELDKVINSYRPEVISVFSVEKARQISDVCVKYNKKQKLLLRVHAPGDVLFLGMEGGFMLDELPSVIDEIAMMPAIEIAGVSTFPAVAYDKDGTVPAATPNLATLNLAKDALFAKGIPCAIVNAPGNNCCATMKLLADNGVTHVEPGSALTGSNTYHLFTDDEPEEPAMVYVTEISHFWDNKAYVFGEGFFIDDPPVTISSEFQHYAFFGSDPSLILDRKLKFTGIGARPGSGFAKIDYHGILETDGQEAHVGDSVVFGFRGQLFMTRAYSAVVESMSSGNPRLVGIWDWSGHRVGGGIE